MSDPSPDFYCNFCDICYYTPSEHSTDLACASYQKHEADQLAVEVAGYRKEFITEGERTNLEFQIGTMKHALNLIAMKSKCGYAIQAADSALLNVEGEKTESA